MILKVDLNEYELESIIQNQLDGGPSIQVHFKAAIRFFNSLLVAEKRGKKIAFVNIKGYKEIGEISQPSEILKEVLGDIK